MSAQNPTHVVISWKEKLRLRPDILNNLDIEALSSRFKNLDNRDLTYQ